MLVKNVKQLMTEALERINLSWKPSRFELGQLADAINQFDADNAGPYIDKRYLDEGVCNKLEKYEQNGDTEIRLSLDHMNKIARYARYKSYAEFALGLSRTQRSSVPQLDGCVGWWYSIVRCNSERKALLFSPVHISFDQKKEGYHMEMFGPSRTFEGAIECQSNCMISLVKAEQEKQIYVEFQVGITAPDFYPSLLRGVYAGHTTGGLPAAGKEILLRMPEAQKREDLPNHRLVYTKSENLANFPDLLDPRIIHYFSDYATTAIKIPPAATFTLDDLPDPPEAD